MSIVTDLITEYGDYYLNSGQNSSRMFKQLYAENTFDQHFTRRESKDASIFQLASVAMSRVLQPFQNDWSPAGEETYTPSPIPLFRLKNDVALSPDDLVDTWMDWLSSSDQDRKTWPLIRWLIEEHIQPKSIEDCILNEAYNGEFLAPPTPGTAGAVSTAMNGVKFTINAHITSGRIAPITTGALATTGEAFVDQVEAFVNDINIRYRRKMMPLIMSVENHALYKEGMIEKYNMNYQQAEIDVLRLYPNIKVFGEEALGTSDKIIATEKSNAIVAFKHAVNESRYQIESMDRTVKVWNDYHKGYGFAIPENVFTNNLEMNP